MSTDPARKTEQLEAEVAEVEEEIDAAVDAHEEAQGTPEGQLWVESGTVRPDLDDQTIAPPG
jgi:hypothetical protein